MIKGKWKIILHISEENDFQTSLANINVEEFAQNSKIETYDETVSLC